MVQAVADVPAVQGVWHAPALRSFPTSDVQSWRRPHPWWRLRSKARSRSQKPWVSSSWIAGTGVSTVLHVLHSTGLFVDLE